MFGLIRYFRWYLYVVMQVWYFMVLSMVLLCCDVYMVFHCAKYSTCMCGVSIFWCLVLYFLVIGAVLL